MLKHRAVFLDRDGVLNRPVLRQGKSYPPDTLEQFHLYPDVQEALQRLHNAGYLLIVVTNQPDVMRGTQKKEVVESMHQYLMEKLPLDDIEVCFDETSPCYKPNPGMLFDAKAKHGICLQSSYLIGDRWRDIDAGASAGCTTIWIENDYNEKLLHPPDYICKNLTEASRVILKQDIFCPPR